MTEKRHHGLLLKAWYDENYGNRHQLSVAVSEDFPEDEQIAIKNGVSNFIRGLEPQERFSKRHHKAFQEKVGQYLGTTLAEILEEMGEDAGSSAGMVTVELERKYIKATAQAETWKEAYEKALANNQRIVDKIVGLIEE